MDAKTSNLVAVSRSVPQNNTRRPGPLLLPPRFYTTSSPQCASIVSPELTSISQGHIFPPARRATS